MRYKSTISTHITSEKNYKITNRIKLSQEELINKKRQIVCPNKKNKVNRLYFNNLFISLPR